jgi:DNA-binding SARP family transcriptional activator
MTLRSLGPPEAACDGAAAPPELLWRKNLALLFYLARSPRLSRTREHLTGLLWGERRDAVARHSLREAIRVLRRVLGKEALTTSSDQVRLAAGVIDLDLDRLDAHAAQGEWEEAAALAGGDLLEGFSVPDAPGFEDWLAAERLAARSRMIEALTTFATHGLAGGDVAAAAEAARRALSLDGASDAAARALMRAAALAGERSAALAAYDRLTERLAALGTEPEAQTERLAEQIRRSRESPRARAHDPGALSRRAPLTGRETLLSRLLVVWDACRDSRSPRVIFVDGEPGLGRTRIVEEAAGRARLDGAAVSITRSVPADAGLPWSALHGLAAGGILEAPGLAGAAAGALATFAQHSEAWADRFPGTRGVAPLEERIGFSAILRAAAQDQPVLLALDDAGWADRESLAALGAVLRDTAALPVCLLVSAAPHPPREELDMLRARIGRDLAGAALMLEPLTPGDLAALARWAMPSWTDEQVDRLARRVAVDSAGIPLLVVELLHAVTLGLDLGASAAWPSPQRTLDQTLPGDLPPTVTAALRVGFQRLGPDTRSVLAAAAILGERCDAATLRRATGLDNAAVESALDEAEWQRWLVADSRGYTFTARLVRDVIAAEMLTPGQRRRVLERIENNSA